jgi:hypothetical protein
MLNSPYTLQLYNRRLTPGPQGTTEPAVLVREGALVVSLDPVRAVATVLFYTGQILVKCWSNTGQILVKHRSNTGQILVKYWSNIPSQRAGAGAAGRVLVK